jgi:hypothetical protein
MNIYIALDDPSDASAGKSAVLGAFTSEERARAACQEYAAIPSRPLEWKDFEAEDVDGTSFAVIMVDLDIPV